MFTKPVAFAGYMVTDPSGNVSFTDADGNPFTLPYPCEYHITTPDPQTPAWGV